MFYLPDAVAQQTIKEGETPTGFWRGLFSGTLMKTILLLFVFASINYGIELFRKDKILKKLLKKYLAFEMVDGKRYRGTMRLESNGLEIISEESRQRGLAPSYLFTDKEREGIKAYIRYLDSMNERERLERNLDLERVYHPRLPTRMRRKIRNFGIARKNSVNKTVELVWGKVKQTAIPKSVEQQHGQEIDTAQKQLWEYAMEESYERLIERLVGTRVKVQVGDDQYIAVLKEYNDQHIYLMDVKRTDGLGYMDPWTVTLDIEHNKVNKRDDRGLRCKIEDRDLILESNVPYEVQLWGLKFQRDDEEDNHDWKWNYRIPTFSVQKIFLEPHPKNYNVGPFVRVVTQEPRTHSYFKLFHLNFRSFREADVVFPRKYCKIVESAEKYQAELLDLGGLTEAILSSKKTKEITIADKDGKPIQGLNIIEGYITNVNEDRIDIKAINHSYSRRWAVEQTFHRFDEKLRTVGPAPVRVLPSYRARMATQTTLVDEIGVSKPESYPISPLLYLPVVPRFSPYKKPKLPMKVLALMGNTTDVEFPVLHQFGSILDHRMLYEQVRDLWTSQIARAHLLWIGHGEIYKDGYRLDIDTENRIKNFVSRGGIVIVSGQDMSNFRRRGVGWIPELLIGDERDEIQEFTPTRIGKPLFEYPHHIQSGQIKVDDRWVEWTDKYKLYATTNGGHEAVVLLLPFQAGLYIVTSLKNETQADVQMNQAMMENLLYFSIKWFDQQKHRYLYYTPR